MRGGASLADALDDAPVFPKFYVNVVRAGEQSGDLKGVLDHLAAYLDRSTALREAVVSALIYPLLLLATAGVSIVIVLVYVLPSFEPLFAESGKTLPFATRVVMGVGHFMANWFWLILLALVAAAVGMREGLKNAAFRKGYDRLLLRLPLFGPLLTKIDVERFSRTLGTLLANGVTLPQALQLTGDTLANSVIGGAVRAAATRLKKAASWRAICDHGPVSVVGARYDQRRRGKRATRCHVAAPGGPLSTRCKAHNRPAGGAARPMPDDFHGRDRRGPYRVDPGRDPER